MGRALSLWSQMISLAAFRLVPSGAETIFSAGVMNSLTGVAGSMRLVTRPSILPVPVPSSVTAMVEWPVRSFKASTSASVSPRRRLESLMTKPAL